MLGHRACRGLAAAHEIIAILRRSEAEARSLAQALGPCKLLTGIDALAPGRIEQVLRETSPDIVLNCVGLIKQRPEAGDTMLAIELNALLPHRLAKACSEINAKLVQVSTDCVFSGSRGFYAETDMPDPTDTYGRTKLLGEITEAPHLTLRTSIIGSQLEGHEGLVAWFLAQRGRAIKGYRHAIFSGLTTGALTQVLDRVFTEHATLTGLYHVAAAPISKLDLLTELGSRLGWSDPIEPVHRPVIDRSLDGRRFVEATGIVPPSWDEMLDTLGTELGATRIPVSRG